MHFFLRSPMNLSEIGKQLIEAQDSQNNFQSLALDLLKDLELMHEAPSQGGDEAQTNEETQFKKMSLQTEELRGRFSRELLRLNQWTLKQKVNWMRKMDDLEEVQVPIDATSIDEEIDLTRNFDEELDQTIHEDYQIFTSQFDQ